MGKAQQPFTEGFYDFEDNKFRKSDSWNDVPRKV